MLSALLTGCGWLEDQPEGADADLPVPLSIDEMLDTDAATETATGFQLEVGERFPLKKTVDQTLVQGSSRSRSRLELWVQLAVAEQTGEETRLEARFLDVRYEHEIGDQKVAFDSRSVSGLEHAETRAYRGLVNNQFSFWIDADHQFVRVDEDFQTFLQHCLAGVPQAQRDVAYSMHVGRLGRPQLASFLDDGIGILPAGDLREMQQWTRPLMLPQPLPESLQMTCTLTALKDKSALVEFSGAIASQSRRELMLDLVAILPDGTRVPQQKTITSRLEAFPETPPDLSLQSYRTPSAPSESAVAPELRHSAVPTGAAEAAPTVPDEVPSAQY
jgi:hypothetical protein